MSLQILVLLENPFKDISPPNVWQGLGWALLLINGVTAAQGVAPAVSQAIARQEGTDELLSVWPLWNAGPRCSAGAVHIPLLTSNCCL